MRLKNACFSDCESIQFVKMFVVNNNQVSIMIEQLFEIPYQFQISVNLYIKIMPKCSPLKGMLLKKDIPAKLHNCEYLPLSIIIYPHS